MCHSDKEILEIVKAFLAGKQIQFFSPTKSTWLDCIGHPSWDFDNTNYRIKPEPKLRRYYNADEFRKAQKEHGPYIKLSNGDYLLPFSVYGNGISVVDGFSGRLDFVSYETLSDTKYYTWEDGTPCGIVTEE